MIINKSNMNILMRTTSESNKDTVYFSNVDRDCISWTDYTILTGKLYLVRV